MHYNCARCSVALPLLHLSVSYDRHALILLKFVRTQTVMLPSRRRLSAVGSCSFWHLLSVSNFPVPHRVWRGGSWVKLLTRMVTEGVKILVNTNWQPGLLTSWNWNVIFETGLNTVNWVCCWINCWIYRLWHGPLSKYIARIGWSGPGIKFVGGIIFYWTSFSTRQTLLYGGV